MKLKLITAAAALLMTTGAQAAIVTYSGSFLVTENINGTDFNFGNGAVGPETTIPGWDLNIYRAGTTISFFWNNLVVGASGGVAGTITGPYFSLGAGAVVSAASTFSNVVSGLQTTAFQTTGTHVLGFRFYNEATSAVNYGYLTMTNTATSGFPAVVTGWSYENTGGAITVPGAVVPGAVPEPATWGLMLAGFGIVGGAMRRRQRTSVSFA